MLKIINKFLNSKVYLIFKYLYLFFIFIVIIFSVNIFNPYHSFTNKSDSMAPAIDKGSLTIVKRFPTYNIGEAISYYDNSNGPEEIVTHRIRAIGGNVYTTKGDANEVQDRELVKPRLIIGKVIFTIPYLGYLISFAKSPIGTRLGIIAPALLIILLEIMNIIINLKKADQKD